MNTKYVIVGSEKPEHTLGATLRARPPAPWGSVFMVGVHNFFLRLCTFGALDDKHLGLGV